MKKPKPTLDELERYAAVSPATVSRVLNNTAPVSALVRKRVLQAMTDLGYVQARMPVALIVPDVSNPFFSGLGLVFEEILQREGFHVVIASSDGRMDREIALVDHFKASGAHGLIYIPRGEASPTVIAHLTDDRFPVTVFDRPIESQTFDYVIVDSREGTQRAVDYVVAFGHDRIGYLKGQYGTPTASARYEAFVDAVRRNNLDLVEDWIWLGDYQFASGRSCAEELLTLDPADRPTAILAANDAMALGLMQRVQEAGSSVPRDLSIVGFDNIDYAEWSYPRLTTIEQPVRLAAYKAWQLLHRRIEDVAKGESATERPPVSEVIEPRLIPRDSVTRPNRELALVGADEATAAISELFASDRGERSGQGPDLPGPVLQRENGEEE